MISFFSFIAVPLGWVMYFIHQYVGNYGMTLLIFTVLMKILMLPLAISQQKGMAKMAAFRPKMEAIQKKYANNKTKLNEEISKLYQQEQYNPATSCFPILIQLPIVFGLMGVIYYPLTHILHSDAELITKAVELGNSILTNAGIAFRDYTGEINALKAITIDTPAFVAQFGQEFTDSLTGFDFKFMGIFLGDTPSWREPGVLWLIPVLSAAFGAITSWQSVRMNKATAGDNPAANSSNSMLYMMPMMNAYISFIVPAGVGLYWLIGAALTVVQSFVLNKIYNPAEMAEKARVEEETRKEAIRQERIEAKKARGLKITEADLSGDPEAAEEGKPDYSGMSQKEINRIKLAEARKRDAERYGEEYVEVTDDDLK